jgi:hypothetical protein
MASVCISKLAAFMSLNIIDQLILAVEDCCVLFEV